MKRVFIAIKIERSEPLVRLYNDTLALFGNLSVKWVEPDNLHLTLAFLGNMDKKRVKEVCGVMQRVSGKHRPFVLENTGAGFFGRKSEIRVIWIGTNHPQELTSLQGDLAAELGVNGLFEDPGKFTPHITIGRPRRSAGRVDVIIPDELKARRAGDNRVNEIILYESDLSGKTPVYKVIEKVALGGGL